MVIYTKNPSLKRKVFKSINRYENLAIKNYREGKMTQGKKYESKSDKLYKKNYSNIFGIRR